MSRRLISRSADLQKLVEDGYHLEIWRGTFLLVRGIPYRTPLGQVRSGTLVSQLELANDVTVKPEQHVAYFVADETPSEVDGTPIKHMIGAFPQQLADGLVVTHTYSSKPPTGYADYRHKISHYAALFVGPARAADPFATAQVYPLISDAEDETVFLYADTAASRAGIDVINDRLKPYRIGIVGLGGTGSYILDLVAKTPVREIHLFDGDRFIQHNAFRAPGGHAGDDIAAVPQKVAHWGRVYGRLRRGIVEHDGAIDESNVHALRVLDFVFLTVDNGAARRLIVTRLEEYQVPFVDVGMGVYEVDGALGGLVRTTTSTPEERQHVHDKNRIPFGGGGADDYSLNIQIADLNALNATLAVIRWKKLVGYYGDQEREHHSLYQIGGNNIINEDLA